MLDNQGCILSSLPEQERDRQLRKWYLLRCMTEEAPCNEKLEKRRMIREQGFDSKKIRASMGLFNTRKGTMALRMNKRPGEAYEDDRQGEGSGDSLFPGLHDDIALDILAALTSRSDYGSIARLNRRFNSLIRTGYLYRLRRQLGMVEHWVYMLCDLIGWEAFDPNRERWMRLPRMPSDECFNYADKESLAVGTELLVFGRELFGFVIWRYSLLTHSWSRGPGMNLPRCLFGSSSCGEIAIVAGGSDRYGTVLKSAELYNSELGAWETLPDMHSPRKLCSGFFMDGKFYVIGGMLSHTASLTCGEEYNLQTRTWRRIWNMFPGDNGDAHAPPLVAVVNNQLYAVEYLSNEVKKYNKENNTWSVLGRLPVRADSTNGWGLAFKACGNELLVIGGQRGPEGESIVLNSWRPTSEIRGALEWNVLAVKERAGVFVYNCAVMGC